MVPGEPRSSVSYREFRKNLSGYLRQVRQGETIVVTSRGTEVARVVPPAEKPHQRVELVGMFKGRLHMSVDFDETPADLVAAMEDDA